MSEKQKAPPSITDIIFYIALTLAVIFMINGWYQAKIKSLSEPAVKQGAVKKMDALTEPSLYSLEKSKTLESQNASAQAMDMKEVYEKFSKSSAGGNMVEKWSKVKPEEKAKIRESLDGDIEKYREMVERNPEDEKAKKLIKITEMVKSIVSKDFNIGPGDQVVASQAEDPAEINK